MKSCNKCGSLNWDNIEQCCACGCRKLSICKDDNQADLKSALLLLFSIKRTDAFSSYDRLHTALKDISPEMADDVVLMAAVKQSLPFISPGMAKKPELGYAKSVLLNARHPFSEEIVDEVVAGFEAVWYFANTGTPPQREASERTAVTKANTQSSFNVRKLIRQSTTCKDDASFQDACTEAKKTCELDLDDLRGRTKTLSLARIRNDLTVIQSTPPFKECTMPSTETIMVITDLNRAKMFILYDGSFGKKQQDQSLDLWLETYKVACQLALLNELTELDRLIRICEEYCKACTNYGGRDPEIQKQKSALETTLKEMDMFAD